MMTAVLTLSAVLPAGYAFSRYEFRLKELLFLIILLVQLLPLILLIVPMYALFLSLQLLNTPAALVLGLYVVYRPLFSVVDARLYRRRA
jgi:multiple sugar transport system permease protein